MGHASIRTQALVAETTSVTLGSEPTPTTISVSYDIVGARQSRDAMALANECLIAWEQFLKKHRLL